MKFGKQLRNTVEESYADWRTKFMSYKRLKKCLHTCSLGNVNDVSFRSTCSSRFMQQLRVELEKVNDFFLDKQEDLVIEHERATVELRAATLPAASGPNARARVYRARQRLTNLHGELVLLDHFGMINYVAFCKILKKHDKKKCVRIRSSCLQSVSATPVFFSSVVRTLILSIERLLLNAPVCRHVFPTSLVPTRHYFIDRCVEHSADSATMDNRDMELNE